MMELFSNKLIDFKILMQEHRFSVEVPLIDSIYKIYQYSIVRLS